MPSWQPIFSVEGAQYIRTPADNPDYFLWFDQARLDIEAYIDINAVELGRELSGPSFKLSKIKEGKTVCYRQLIDHTITKL